MYSLSDEIVPMLSTAARELDSITVTLPEVKRGEIGIPIGLPATLGMALSESGKISKSKADSKSKSSSGTCPPEFNDNYDKYKDKTEPESNHKNYNKGELDSEGNPYRNVPDKGDPNSSADFFDGDQKIRRRYYDENGNLAKDIDYTNHGNSKQHPNTPHDHYFNWDKEGNPRSEEC